MDKKEGAKTPTQEGPRGFKSRDKQWFCDNCHFLLGYVDENTNQLRLKYKDFVVSISGGSVWHICRRCSKVNVFADPDYEEYLKKKYGKQNLK